MKEGWTRIFTSDSQATVAIIQGMLLENNIQCVAVNNQNSAYANIFGEVELYVHRDDAVQALRLIEQNE